MGIYAGGAGDFIQEELVIYTGGVDIYTCRVGEFGDVYRRSLGIYTGGVGDLYGISWGFIQRVGDLYRRIYTGRV